MRDDRTKQEKVDDYHRAVSVAAIAANMLHGIDFESLIRDIDTADAIGPILDPTLYREKAKALHEDRALLVAAQNLAGVVKRGADHG